MKHLVTAFWAANGSLGLAIVAYAATAFAGARPDALADLRGGLRPPAPNDGTAYVVDIGPMQRVRIVEPKTPVERAPSVDLSRFLSVRNFVGMEAVAQTNEQNMFWLARGDDLYERLFGREGAGDLSAVRGWRVKEVRPAEKKVVFTNGREEQALLAASEAQLLGVDPRYAALVGKAYRASDYTTRVTTNNGSFVSVQFDPNEVHWAIANQKSILDDASLSPVEGGLRFSRVTPASILGARGLQAGDVLEAVNGTRTESIEALRTYLQSLDPRNVRTVSMQLNRSGQTIRLLLSLPPLQAP